MPTLTKWAIEKDKAVVVGVGQGTPTAMAFLIYLDMGLIVKRFYGEGECTIEAFNFASEGVGFSIFDDTDNPFSGGTVILDLESAKKFKKEIARIINQIKADHGE
jgi:hypothetical protein